MTIIWIMAIQIVFCCCCMNYVLKTNSISWAQKQMLTIQTRRENDICFMINNLSLCDGIEHMVWFKSQGMKGIVGICTVMSGTVSWCKTHILYIPHQSESLLWISASICPSLYIWRQTKSHQHNSFLYLICQTLYNSWDSSKKKQLLCFPIPDYLLVLIVAGAETEWDYKGKVPPFWLFSTYPPIFSQNGHHEPYISNLSEAPFRTQILNW